MKDAANRPTGLIPSGHPSIAGGSGAGSGHGGGTGGTGGHSSKLSSSYPPIFYARPGESWQEYWRTVEFWLASEGKSLPPEVQGPRLMQQLRERAAKIVQHLTVQEVAAEHGIDLIRQTMEKSPIIKILDTKKVDKRRQKFMRLGRLSGESIESFLNRAEIYRRENQSSPDYTVGSKFYVGHLLDAAKLTKRDLALIKAAAGGSLEHEEPVTLALLDLAEQLEGLPHFPIGRGEALLDNEDKYLVQKGGGASPSTLSSNPAMSPPPTSGGPRRRRFLNRKRFREALVAIMEGDDDDDNNQEAEEIFAALNEAGEDSLEEDEENLENHSSTGNSSSGASEAGETPLLEIYAQEYKARNKVRELRKMRQYFTKDKAGSQQPEHVKQWVKKQQETDPCFLCGKLGHWSQECPLRKKTPIHASNVVYSANVAFQGREPQQVAADEWELLASYAQRPTRAAEHRVYMVHRESGLMQPPGQPPLQAAPHDLYWTMDELGSKIIVDLGCMRTVAGTTWVNALVRELEGQGRFIKVVKESESFRFGDGHISKSHYGIVVEVALASLHCMLRISVVSGNCPPLLSKSVCSRLGFMIDTEQHMISSKKLRVRPYGLEQTLTPAGVGGHYIMPLTQFDHTMKPVESCEMPEHAEIIVLSTESQRVDRDTSALKATPQDVKTTILGPARDLPDLFGHAMGGSRPGGRGGHGGRRRGSAGRTIDLTQDEEAPHEQGGQAEDGGEADDTFFLIRSSHPRSSDGGEHGHGAGAEDDVSTGSVEQARSRSADAGRALRGGLRRAAGSQDSGQGKQQSAGALREKEEHVTEGSETSRADRRLGQLPNPLVPVLRGCDLQHHGQSSSSDVSVQMEDITADAPGEAGGREGTRTVRAAVEVEAQPPLDDGASRPSACRPLGSSRSSQAVVFQPQDLVVSGCGPGVSDPNLMDTTEEATPAGTYMNESSDGTSNNLMVEPDGASGSFVGDFEDPETYEPVVPDRPQPSSRPIDPVETLLNRGQRTTVLRGLQRAKEVNALFQEALGDPPDGAPPGNGWVLLEIFAGNLARKRGWRVLPPQDIIITGLDITRQDHQQLLKEMIEAQQPDVITLSPKCGPWSAWQRLRRDRALLQAQRRDELPCWDFVEWVWHYQTARGALVVLEEPRQSEALNLPQMHRRKQVYTKFVDQCMLGLRDRVNHQPHKKPTAFQGNHPSVLAWQEIVCLHHPDEHQVIEGSVRVKIEKKWETKRRSELAAAWPQGLCEWLLDSIFDSLAKMSGLWTSEVDMLLDQEMPVLRRLHQATTEGGPVHLTVPVELERQPEAAVRQQMSLMQDEDAKTKYDYISFAGSSATLSRKMRGTIAHLHVALGHIGADKLCRMLALNGAKESVITAVKNMRCGICSQVVSPTPPPKASFKRPSVFNERVCMDTFYVWDAQGLKYAVTHLVDAFSLYQVALVAKDASASTTTRLVRDRWIGTFGPPMTLMTDGGSEFSGTLESVLRTFQVYHDVVPPTAHWRMALAERHGAVLKLMLMKIIKEKSVMGLEEMKSAAACATAARNYQARVSGFSPVQLVFGRESPIPGNLMDVLEKGHMMYHLTDPMSVEDSMRRTLDIKKAAEEAFGWLQAHDALKKAAASRARLPRLELLSEGAQVMFWEPPPNRRGLARRLQDDVSWVGPAMVAAVERKEGSIKRVWVRYRNKLKGLPLEFVRLAVADEIEAQNISSEAFELIEKELTEGRTKALVAPEVPQLTDKNYPVMEFSDDDEPRHVDEEETKTASVLDDVPMAMHKGGHEREAETLRDPALWPFPKRKQVFEPKMSLDQAAQRTKHHLQEMKMKLEGRSTGAAASSSTRATAGDATAAEPSVTAPAKADRKKKGDQNPKSAKAPRTALVVEGVRSVLESYVVLPLQSPLETVWHDGDEAAMINKAAEEFEPKPDFPSPWLPAPGMVDLMPPRHFVGFEQTPVVKPPEHEVNYTRGTWEKPWPNTPVPHVHVPKHVDMLPEMPPALTQPISEAQMRSLTRAKIMWPDQDSWIYDADIEELWRVHQCPREKLFVPQEPTWPSSIKRDWFVGPRVTWMYFEDEHEVVVVDNFRWQGCNPSLRTTDGRLWRDSGCEFRRRSQISMLG